MNIFERIGKSFDYRYNCILLAIGARKLYLKRKYKERTGMILNINHPESFNEKMQWLKLNDIHPEYTIMVDKIEAKDYVRRCIGEEYIIPTIGVWNDVDDIDWNALPERFVIKATNDSSGVVVCKDKSLLDIEDTKDKLRSKGNRDYSKWTLEYPYRNVPHRFIAEQYIEDESGCELKDYKIFCFNGVPRFIQVDSGRFVDHRRDMYDMEWRKLPFELKYKSSNLTINRPVSLDEMLCVARKLSKGIPFLRVDLYDVFGKVYFGEMTFFPGGGYESFVPFEWDLIFGRYLQLPV